MPQRHVTYITYAEDDRCREIRRLIEEAGIIVDVRDLGAQPLSREELDQVLGHIDPRHYLNPLSKAYAKHKLDTGLPPRDELLQLIAEDNTLLKRPIIKTNRLMTIGCDKEAVAVMLQISPESPAEPPDEPAVETRNGVTNGGSNNRQGRRRMSAAGAAAGK